MLVEKRRNLPGIQSLPRQLARGVVTAGQPHDVEVQTKVLHLGDHFTRQLNRKSQIVTRGNEAHRPPLHLEQARDKWRRTDWLPELAQLFKRQMILNTRPHVLRRDSLPDNIRDIARYMIEDPYLDFRV